MSRQTHDRERDDALRELGRLQRQGDALGGPFAQRADAPDGGDPVERWGIRIGRTLSWLAFLVLSLYLVHTYLR
jgi:hypothetical protein